MTQTSTYDRILHTFGLAALALNGAALAYPKVIPVWLLIVALVVVGVAQVSTMPIAARPDSIIKAARSAPASALLPMALLFAFSATLMGCPPTSTTPAGSGVSPSPISTFDACADQAVEGKALALIGEIAKDTLGGDYMSALETLASQVGLPVAMCAGQLFVDTMQRKAAMDATAQLQRERAQMWLAKHTHDGGVTVLEPPPTGGICPAMPCRT